MASEGRESTVYSVSPSCTWSTAKKVFSLRSVTTTLSTRASSVSRMFLMRSWVIGRAGATFSSSSAIALASKMPTQICSDRLSSSSRRMMIGMFETASRASPRTFISTNMRPPPVGKRVSPQAVRQHLVDVDLRQITDGRASLPVEVDDAVATGPARQLSGILLRGSVHQHFQRLAREPAAPLGTDPRRQVEECQVAAGFHVVGDLIRHRRGGGSRPPRVAE